MRKPVPAHASTRTPPPRVAAPVPALASVYEPDDDVELVRYSAPLPWPLGSEDDGVDEEE